MITRNPFLEWMKLVESRKKFPMAEALKLAYQGGEIDDETLEPRVLCDAEFRPIGRFQDGDYIIFGNILAL
jgi:hypothetical protein